MEHHSALGPRMRGLGVVPRLSCALILFVLCTFTRIPSVVGSAHLGASGQNLGSWLLENAEALQEEPLTPKGLLLIKKFLELESTGKPHTNADVTPKNNAMQQQLPFPIPPELIGLILSQGGSLTAALPLVINMLRAKIEMLLAGQLLDYTRHICANGQLKELSNQVPGILKTLLLRGLGDKLFGLKELDGVVKFLRACLEGEGTNERAADAMTSANILLTRSSQIVRGQVGGTKPPPRRRRPRRNPKKPGRDRKQRRRRRHRRHTSALPTSLATLSSPSPPSPSSSSSSP